MPGSQRVVANDSEDVFYFPPPRGMFIAELVVVVLELELDPAGEGGVLPK